MFYFINIFFIYFTFLLKDASSRMKFVKRRQNGATMVCMLFKTITVNTIRHVFSEKMLKLHAKD